MADKMVFQQELVQKVAELVVHFAEPAGSVLFLAAAYTTLEREWQGIDRLR